jgi:hypothetical protein
LELAQTADSPGLILLAADGSVIGTNTAGDQWLDELNVPGTDGVPLEVHALTARLRAPSPSAGVPQVRVRTRAGRWAILQASWMPKQGHDTVAVIIQQAAAYQIAPVVMSAYGLTQQEQNISGLVFHGLSTHAIAESCTSPSTPSRTT